jgi:flavin reductase (DIM6/NTAB) family NADH-FMN oxidoreductase RutF
MLSINVKDLSVPELHNYLQYAIAPRPICFASTVDKAGNVNLSPFSFFNLFGSNPPTCVFSPSRRVRDNTTKHTLENIKEVPECVINIVTYDMVQQTSLASVEYPKGVNEFIKSGFTPIASELVRPPRVAESPVQFECIVNEIKVARLGGDWYARINKDNLFKVAKPVRSIGIGVDAIPYAIRNSKVLTGNNLGQLGNVEVLPTDEQMDDNIQSPEIKEILDATIGDSQTRETQLHLKAKQLLDECRVEEAWKVLLIS